METMEAEEAQEIHDAARAVDPETHDSACWCCCAADSCWELQDQVF